MSSAGPESCAETRPVTWSGRRADTRTCSLSPIRGDCPAPISSMLSPYASVEATTSLGPWKASSASNVACKSRCSRLSLGYPPNLHPNQPALAPRSVSNRLRTSYGPTSSGTFCPLKCVLYEVLGSVSAAVSLQSRFMRSNHFELCLAILRPSGLPGLCDRGGF